MLITHCLAYGMNAGNLRLPWHCVKLKGIALEPLT
jgi:hypothetical protein